MKAITRNLGRLLIFAIFSSSLVLITFLRQCEVKRPVQTCLEINDTQMKSREVAPKPTRYLWCVNHYGPNSQLKDVVKCMILAIMYNLTMILPPLHPHIRDTTKGVQRFEHFHDMRKLKHILNFTTMEQYFERAHVNMDCYVHHRFRIHTKLHYGKHTLDTVAKHLNVSFSFNRNLSVSPLFTSREFERVTRQCSSIYLYMRFEWTFSWFRPLNRYAKLVMQYWDRSALIHRLALESMEYLKRQFLGNTTTNSSVVLGVAHLRRGDMNVMSIEKFGMQLANLLKTGRHFTHLYIMCPYLKADEVSTLQRIISVPLVTTAVLSPHLRVAMDEFLFDIVEQELGFHAPVFIGSPFSTYSATIYLRKVFQNKGDAYVFARKNAKTPTKLTKENAGYFDIM